MAKFSSKLLIVSSIFLVFGFTSSVYVFAAYNIEKAKQLKYPIGELGNCQSFEECKVYCNRDENIPKCDRFGIKNGLYTAEEAADTELMLSLMEESGLPGKCRGTIECFSYCESAAHLDECWDYAQRHNLVPEGWDVETVRRLAQLARGGERFPGGCSGHDECEAYCENPNNMEECLNFAEQHGLIPSDELAEARKVSQALKRGAGLPGNCRGREQCMAYCSEPAHMEECFAFAEKAGLIPPEELEMARRVMPLMMRGETPGGCKSKEECEAYCTDDSHMEECAQFALNTGIMTQEDYEMFKKTGGKGPGDCRGEEECKAFCENPANQETCLNFAKEHGLLSEEDMRQMEEGLRQMQEGLANAPPEVVACLEEKLGVDVVAGIRSGSGVPTPQMGDIMRGCFEQLMPAPGDFGPPPGSEGSYPQEGFSSPQGIPSGFTGPGGCTSPEECQRYCSDPAHQQECGQFAPPPSNYQPPSDYQPPSEEQPLPEEPSGFLRQIRQAAASLLTNFLNLVK